MHKFIERNVFFCMCGPILFHLEEMAEYNSPEIDDWFAQTWYETLLSAFCEKGENFNLPSAERLLSGDYGFSLSI